MTTPSYDAETVTIIDTVSGATEITGWPIGDISTWALEDGKPRPRWSRQRVWKLSHGYAIAREAYSLIYHRPGTECRTAGGQQSGDLMSVAQMLTQVAAVSKDPLGDLVSCDTCQPDWPENLHHDAMVRYETPRLTVEQCDSPEAVITRLSGRKKRDGTTITTVPRSTRALLSECASRDPDWVSAARPTVVIR